jgi:hypothetical protein
MVGKWERMMSKQQRRKAVKKVTKGESAPVPVPAPTPAPAPAPVPAPVREGWLRKIAKALFSRF